MKLNSGCSTTPIRQEDRNTRLFPHGRLEVLDTSTYYTKLPEVNHQILISVIPSHGFSDGLRFVVFCLAVYVLVGVLFGLVWCCFRHGGYSWLMFMLVEVFFFSVSCLAVTIVASVLTSFLCVSFVELSIDFLFLIKKKITPNQMRILKAKCKALYQPEWGLLAAKHPIPSGC